MLSTMIKLIKLIYKQIDWRPPLHLNPNYTQCREKEQFPGELEGQRFKLQEKMVLNVEEALHYVLDLLHLLTQSLMMP